MVSEEDLHQAQIVIRKLNLAIRMAVAVVVYRGSSASSGDDMSMVIVLSLEAPLAQDRAQEGKRVKRHNSPNK